MSGLMTIPEFILHQTLTAALDYVRADFYQQADETKSYLYLLLNGPELERYNMYEQAKEIICTREDDARHITIDLMFNKSHDAVPAIHIVLPAEQTQGGGNALGLGEMDDFEEDDDTISYRNVYTRRSQATYNIVIFSDNSNEAILLTHFMKALLIATTQSLHLSGLQNLMIGAGDVQPYQDIMPNLFQRVVSVNLQYETSVPVIDRQYLIRQIEIKGTPVDK